MNVLLLDSSRFYVLSYSQPYGHFFKVHPSGFQIVILNMEIFSGCCSKILALYRTFPYFLTSPHTSYTHTSFLLCEAPRTLLTPSRPSYLSTALLLHPHPLTLVTSRRAGRQGTVEPLSFSVGITK